MKATDIIERVSTALFDSQHVRWTLGELVNYINDAQHQIVLLRPDSNSVMASIKLDAGTRQSIPAAAGTDPAGTITPPGVRFLRSTRNMGADGLTPGRAVRESSRVAMDNALPGWHSDTARAVENTIFDDISPRHFSVYPGVPASTDMWLEIIYSGLPAAVVLDANGPTPATNELTLGDEYINPVMDFVLARCYAKDASYAGNMGRASMHLQAFGNTLGVTMDIGKLASAPQAAAPLPAAAPTANSRI